MKLPAPKAVIFDWDNTLVNTWPVIREALNATFRKWNLPEWTLPEVRARVHKAMRDSFPEIFGPNWQEPGAYYQAQYRAVHLQKLTALPRAEEVLQAVKEKGLYSVVVSNKKGINLRQEVEHLGWAGLLDATVGSEDAMRDKPHGDPVHLAFEKSHLKPGPGVWFIGDSKIDLECALGTGCTAILYGDSAPQEKEFTATHYHGFPYHAHVHNHTQTLELLKTL